MRLRRRESGAHRIHSNVGRSEGAPPLDALVPFVLLEPLNTHPGIDAEVLRIPAGFFEKLMELLDVRLSSVVRRPSRRHPTITEPSGPLERGLCGSSEPDRDGALNGQGIDPGIVDHVMGGAVRHQRLGPELAQYLNLLFHAAPACLKFLAQRIVLNVIPAKADTKSQTPATQDIDLRRLLGDQHGLALWQDEDTCRKLEPC